MKKNYIILSAFVIAIGAFSFQKSGNKEIEKMIKGHKLNASGKGGLYAGAPGDNNCNQCHGGTSANPVQNGATVNTLTFLSGTTPVTSYTPGATYNVSLTMNPNPSKKGFQSVAMNSSNAVTGTFATVSMGGVQIMSGNRATHTSSSNTSSNPAWVWSWTAPSTNEGDITFYVGSMAANGNGSTDLGDAVYTSQHIISATAGLNKNVQDKYSFSAGYSSTNNTVSMDFNSLISGDMYFNLIDLNGRSVFTYDMGHSQIGKNNEKIVLPTDLKSGMYVVNMFVNNNAMSQKIMIQK